MSPRSSIETVGNRALNARYHLFCYKSVLLAMNKIYHKFASNVKQFFFLAKNRILLILKILLILLLILKILLQTIKKCLLSSPNS